MHPHVPQRRVEPEVANSVKTQNAARLRADKAIPAAALEFESCDDASGERLVVIREPVAPSHVEIRSAAPGHGAGSGIGERTRRPCRR